MRDTPKHCMHFMRHPRLVSLNNFRARLARSYPTSALVRFVRFCFKHFVEWRTSKSSAQRRLHMQKEGLSQISVHFTQKWSPSSNVSRLQRHPETALPTERRELSASPLSCPDVPAPKSLPKLASEKNCPLEFATPFSWLRQVENF